MKNISHLESYFEDVSFTQASTALYSSRTLDARIDHPRFTLIPPLSVGLPNKID